MSKELTPLKALKIIKRSPRLSYLFENFEEELDTIENALEELDFYVRQYRYLQELLVKVNHDKEKYRKALEIIKKYINIVELGEDELFPYYIRDKQYVSNRSCCIMIKEEYEILKEILK